MKNLKTIAAGSVIAGTLGLAALGIGSGVANAAPPSPTGQWAQDRGWGYGHDHWGGPGYGPVWAPPPPPYYGYGGYGGYGAPCATGPLGFVHVCA